MIALALVRSRRAGSLGRLVRHQAVDRVDIRLRERGLACGRYRCWLIPVLPFAPLNYAGGASGVRVLAVCVGERSRVCFPRYCGCGDSGRRAHRWTSARCCFWCR